MLAQESNHVLEEAALDDGFNRWLFYFTKAAELVDLTTRIVYINM